MTAENQVLNTFEKKHQDKTYQPNAKQDPSQIAFGSKHQQGTGKLHVALVDDIQVVGDQPEHGAGSGADDFSQKGEDQEKNQII